MTEKISTTLRESSVARWTALILLASTMFCLHVYRCTGTVEHYARTKSEMDTRYFRVGSRFGVFSECIAFFSDFAGIILDKMGVRLLLYFRQWLWL